MKRVNSVRLDGAVDTCRIVSDSEGLTVARLSVFTLMPRPGVNRERQPSERFERMYHRVRLAVPTGEAGWLRDLESDFRVGVRTLRPCHVEGMLLTDGDMSVVNCKPDGFAFTDSIRVDDNNRCLFVGEVSSVSHTDKTATVVLSTGVSDVRSFILRSTNRGAWDDVASGRIAKGDALQLEGPLHSLPYTDGKRNLFVSTVTPHVMKKITLKREKQKGVVM